MSPLQHTRLGQVAIVCENVQRATAFYRDILGVPFLFSAGPGLSFFDVAGTRLMLSAAEGDANGTSVLYFLVNDIEARTKELEAAGVRFTGAPHMVARMPDHYLWLAEFRDSENNVLALMEEKRETPPA